MTKQEFIKKIRKNWHLIVLIILICFSCLFAFYDFSLRYNLDDETIREAIVGIEGARQKQAPLVGGFSSAAPFTWGPWFYYQMILASLVLPTFYSPWIYLGIGYILSVITLYKIGRILEDKEFGLILAALGTFSPALIIGSTHLTFPNLITFYSLLSVFLFIKIIKKDVSYWWAFFFGIVLGIGINIHYQTASLLILPLIMLVYKKRRVWYFLSYVIGFLIPFIPLILFDLTNHWFNLKNFTYYYLHGKDLIYVPNRWLFYIRDFWPAYWGDVIGIPNIIAFGLMVSTAMLLTYQFTKKKLSVPILLLAIAFFIDFFAMRYYWGERFFGYFNFLRPYVFIFTGYVIYYAYKNIKHGRIILISILLFLAILILPKSFNRLNPDPFNKDMYRRVSELTKRYPDKKFSVYICEDLYRGNDQRIPKSVLYILEKERKIDPKGYKIGVEKHSCVRKAIKLKTINKEGLQIADQKKFPEIAETDFYDFSKADENLLKKAGWKLITFRSIYDSTSRWWFKEQP